MTFDIDDVIARDMCVGCGGCSVVTGGAIPVTLTRFGLYKASLDGVTEADKEAANQVCPFSDHAKNEDELADERFPGAQRAAVIGRYREIYAGRLTDDARLIGSSSGGFTSLVLEGLLERDMVDAIVHVGRNPDSPLFGYRISTSIEEVLSARKSSYYATTLTEIMQVVQDSDQRFALVGLPCMVRASRLLADQMPDVRERLKYFVGLVCGHLKSQFFAESLGWQAGIEPQELASIDFRVKNPSQDSNFYDYRAVARSGAEVAKSVRSTIDGSWGFGAFQPEACNFCDDLFAETADVVLGDAWLPRYKADWRGTSLAVVRNPDLVALFRDAAAAGTIILDDLPVQEAVASQASGVRHRQDGMQVRLADDLAAGLKVPTKRLPPGYVVAPERVALIRQRRSMSRLSLEKFAEARERLDFKIYSKPMRAAIDKYRRIEARSTGAKGMAKYAARKVLRRM